MLAVNLFHMRGGKIVDRRDMFWEDLPEFEEAAASLAEEDADTVDLVSEPHLEPDPATPAPEVIADSEESDQYSVLASPFETDLPASEVVSANCALPELAAQGTTQLATNFSPSAFFSALLKQLYLDQAYVPRHIYVPVDFPDRQLLADALRERCGQKIEIAVPQRGDKRSLVDLVCQNAKQSYDQRFRVLQPSIKAMQEALQDALTLPEPPARIECFDISHIQGAETVASMVVWEDGKMNKAEYRKFKVMTVLGVDDFASMREVVHRRYKRLKEEERELPSLILIDGGLGQLHAAADALESLGFTSQPLASIAKREEVIYLYGSEDEPIVLDRRSPVLHLVQMIRDESHRFAVGYHRQRRAMRDRKSELLEIPGVGPRARQRLIEHFGSLRDVQQATVESLAAVVQRKTAETIWKHFHEAAAAKQ
jgi:excinuclease ABC subunit C